MGKPIRSRKRLLGAALLICISSIANCTYGSVEDGQAQSEAMANFLLGNARAPLTLQLRFTDGGTDSIKTFTTTAGSVSLTTLKINVSEIDLTYAPGFFKGILTYFLYLHRQGSLYAHGEETINSGDAIFKATGFNFVLSSADSTDLGGRQYQSLNLERSVPVGEIKSIRIHISSIETTGTLNATPFATVYSTANDASASLSCTINLSSASTASKPVQINFARLFLTGSDAGSFESGFSDSEFLKEVECIP